MEAKSRPRARSRRSAEEWCPPAKWGNWSGAANTWPWRIALASGTAFIVSQLLDVAVFNRWRKQSWWKAPFFGSTIASVIDTAIFFFVAFAGTALDWMLLAAGDLGVKWLMAAVLLAPYRAMLPYLQSWVPRAAPR